MENKTALVLGASRGIGKEIALQLAEQGCKVILLARDEEKLKTTLNETKNPSLHKYYALDINNRKELKNIIDQKILPQNSIDILIANSGGPKGGPLLEANEEELLLGFENHILATHVILKSVVPSMKDNKFGRIINIISTSVKIPIPNLGVSNTIRGAVASYNKTLAGELGPFGITVNNILPGFTDTDRLKSLIKSAADKTKSSEKDISQKWRETVPLKRFADPKETAHAAIFLCSEQASYINGINLPVDGGRTGTL